MGILARKRSIGIAVTFSLLSGTAQGATIHVEEPNDWCRAVNGAEAGDEVLLAPGIYTRPCRIWASGSPGNPIVLRSEDTNPARRAVLQYEGSSQNVLDLDGVQHLVIRGLSFSGTQLNVDAIKIHRSRDIVIEQCFFRGIGGISISAVSGSSARITVRDNVLQNLRATGMYFGCHDGTTCEATELRVERNLVVGVDAPEGAVGYGLQFKLNSFGVIRNNMVSDTKGPGIMVYGSNRGHPATLVEHNHVQGSRRDGGIVIGGGSAIVRNNVVVGNEVAGIVAQDYRGRGLQQGVRILHNTVLRNRQAGIRVESWSEGAGNELRENMIEPLPGTPAIVPRAVSGKMWGNRICKHWSECLAARDSPEPSRKNEATAGR